MIGDWVSDKYGYLMQISFVGNGYAGFEDDEGNLCQLDDKCNQPELTPLTPEILEKNGWKAGEMGEYRREPYKLFQTKKDGISVMGFKGLQTSALSTNCRIYCEC